jgi:branched-chain amino acid transport system ATP-binding protein
MKPSTEIAPILSVRNLNTGYSKKQVLFDVSLDVMPGEVLLVTGGNGSGKSTLLKAIYGLLQPWNVNAEILFRPVPNGAALNTQPANLNLFKGLAYLPQKNSVFDDLTVEENLRLAGCLMKDNQGFLARFDEVLNLLPALKLLLRRKPGKMSGGERQMVALAIVLFNRPKLILLDEPLAGLSEKMVGLISSILEELNIREEISLLIVEHRRWHLPRLVFRRIVLNLGSVCETEQSIESSLVKI